MPFIVFLGNESNIWNNNSYLCYKSSVRDELRHGRLNNTLHFDSSCTWFRRDATRIQQSSSVKCDECSQHKPFNIWKKLIDQEFFEACSNPCIHVLIVRRRRRDEEPGRKCSCTKSICKLFWPYRYKRKPRANVSTGYGCVDGSHCYGSMGSINLGLFLNKVNVLILL